MPHDYLRDLDALADERPVIYYDQIGCGRSDRTDDSSLWTLGIFVDEIDTVRSALELDRVHLFGQSAGGWIAIEYALRDPAGLVSLHLANTCASISVFEREVTRLKNALPDRAGAVIDEHESAGTTTHPDYVAAFASFNRLHLMGTDVVPEHVVAAMQGMNQAAYASMIGSEWKCTGNMAGWDVTDRARPTRSAGAGDLRSIRRDDAGYGAPHGRSDPRRPLAAVRAVRPPADGHRNRRVHAGDAGVPGLGSAVVVDGDRRRGGMGLAGQDVAGFDVGCARARSSAPSTPRPVSDPRLAGAARAAETGVGRVDAIFSADSRTVSPAASRHVVLPRRTA